MQAIAKILNYIKVVLNKLHTSCKANNRITTTRISSDKPVQDDNSLKRP